jgi:hypothetical protein
MHMIFFTDVQVIASTGPVIKSPPRANCQVEREFACEVTYVLCGAQETTMVQRSGTMVALICTYEPCRLVSSPQRFLYYFLKTHTVLS